MPTMTTVRVSVLRRLLHFHVLVAAAPQAASSKRQRHPSWQPSRDLRPEGIWTKARAKLKDSKSRGPSCKNWGTDFTRVDTSSLLTRSDLTSLPANSTVTHMTLSPAKGHRRAARRLALCQGTAAESTPCRMFSTSSMALQTNKVRK